MNLFLYENQTFSFAFRLHEGRIASCWLIHSLKYSLSLSLSLSLSFTLLPQPLSHLHCVTHTHSLTHSSPLTHYICKTRWPKPYGSKYRFLWDERWLAPYLFHNVVYFVSACFFLLGMYCKAYMLTSEHKKLKAKTRSVPFSTSPVFNTELVLPACPINSELQVWLESHQKIYFEWWQ